MKILIPILMAFVLSGCPRVNRNNFISTPAEDDKYTVLVRASSGDPVANAVVALDYQGGGILTEYAPPKFRTDSLGRVSIPHVFAEKKGWEFLWVTGTIKGKSMRNTLLYHEDVRWPQVVTLTEPD